MLQRKLSSLVCLGHKRIGFIKKASRRLTKLVAHDPNNEAKIGDNVIIEFSKPISKTKKWKLVEILEK